MGIEIDHDLDVRLLPDGRRAELLAPFRARLPWIDVRVPAGFRTDFASVPRLFWRILPPWGPYARAAVVHDYLYVNGVVLRYLADRALLEIMRACRVPGWQRLAIYAAVRLFGWTSFRRKRRRPRPSNPLQGLVG